VTKKKNNSSKQYSQLTRDIIEGIQDIINLREGKPSGARVSFYQNGRSVCVRDIRDSLGFTAEEFAFAFGFNIKNIHNWEQGIRKPNDYAFTLLSMIERNPYTVYESIHGKLKIEPPVAKKSRAIKKEIAEMRGNA
jgi:hypothetical protein